MVGVRCLSQSPHPTHPIFKTGSLSEPGASNAPASLYRLASTGTAGAGFCAQFFTWVPGIQA